MGTFFRTDDATWIGTACHMDVHRVPSQEPTQSIGTIVRVPWQVKYALPHISSDARAGGACDVIAANTPPLLGAADGATDYSYSLQDRSQRNYSQIASAEKRPPGSGV